MKVHEFIIENHPIATVISCQTGSMKLEFCQEVQLPDGFRTENFGPIQEFELPHQKGTNQEFGAYLERMRNE